MLVSINYPECIERLNNYKNNTDQYIIECNLVSNSSVFIYMYI